MSDAKVEYQDLIDRYVSGKISVQAFQSTFLQKFKGDTRHFSEAEFDVLDTLFGDLDAFTDDLGLIAESPDFYLTAAALRERVASARVRLANL